MDNEIVQISAATVTALAPFMPFLTDTAKLGAETLTKMIVQKGGEAAWQRAQALWSKIKSRFGNDNVINGAAIMVAAQPADERLQTVLASVLAERLQEDPELTKSLVALLGGQTIVQSVVADQNSWVENIQQYMEDITGSQIVHASADSVIIDINQQAKKTG